MKKTTFKEIEKCSIQDLKHVLFSVGSNKKIIFLDFVLEDEVVSELLESLKTPLEEFLQANLNQQGIMITSEEENLINGILESIFEDKGFYEKDLSFYLPFTRKIENLYDFINWKKNPHCLFYDWIEFDFTEFFKQNI